jgi:mono/diheme cytochrome c family protein
VASAPVLAQDAGVAKGEDLAKTHCAGCHELTAAKGRDVQGRYVPSLTEVANTPHYSLARLRRIIAVPPHSGMPTAQLDVAEINTLAIYIQSLKKKAE